MHLQLDLTKIERKRAIDAWLTYHGLGKAQIAQSLGVDPSFVTYVMQGKRKSRRVFDELVRMGIPEELLPDPGTGPGRPGKQHRGEHD